MGALKKRLYKLDITGNKVRSGKKIYEVGSTLLGLLSESNEQALKDAVLKVKVENGKITAISSLELNTGDDKMNW